MRLNELRQRLRASFFCVRLCAACVRLPAQLKRAAKVSVELAVTFLRDKFFGLRLRHCGVQGPLINLMFNLTSGSGLISCKLLLKTRVRRLRAQRFLV